MYAVPLFLSKIKNTNYVTFFLNMYLCNLLFTISYLRLRLEAIGFYEQGFKPRGNINNYF